MEFIFETMLDNAKTHEERVQAARIANRLAEQGIELVSELEGLTKFDLKKQRGISDKSIHIIEKLLSMTFADGEPRSVTLSRERAERNQSIRKDFENGLRKAEIARKYGISATQVGNIIANKHHKYPMIDTHRLEEICKEHNYLSPIRVIENLMLRNGLIERSDLTFDEVLSIDGAGVKTVEIICEYLGVDVNPDVYGDIVRSAAAVVCHNGKAEE